ncbi:serine/threonine-protein kinase [Glycomyces salinus]|uniref:serine/threonine-protein kinase n=1 Tax=Glycomyces salinus TaxID=980294 RepID=UPI0018EB8331|nr:serine/threonine-protein kinase [Glycomyces salinus]
MTTNGQPSPRELVLGKKWILGDRIGGGGFGQVFAAQSEAGVQAAVKFVPKEPGAERELLFVELEDVRNVMPILDSGETEESWVLVMPRAERSLRELMDTEAPFDLEASLPILSDIATALLDLEGRVVHRDLKPENILHHQGRWCLADFGISRYAEAATAAETHKFSMSQPYAAPERWRFQHATESTDVYSFGVIAYEFFAGALPFPGPDFRDQHLHDDPEPLVGVRLQMTVMIEDCLNKQPEARPQAANIVARLEKISKSAPAGGLARLEEANHAETKRRSEMAREESRARSEAELRAGLFKAAQGKWLHISRFVSEQILENAPSVEARELGDVGWKLHLGDATLMFSPPTQTEIGLWGSVPPPAFRVIAHTGIALEFPRDRRGYSGRSHSLWFCDAQVEDEYHWFESAFMFTPLLQKGSSRAPFALNPSQKAAEALAPGTATTQLAWPFEVLEIEDLDEFISRWAGWFADASQNRLGSPSIMPERSPQGSWRRR